ncbi:MAG: MFS transporter [Clostridia bacterium]|nr:MFS transporter [Clostridia bacterium]
MEEKKYVGKKELWMFALGAGGQGMIYAMMSSYISDYYVNVLQLNLWFVLGLMLLARVWDAINDPLMGMIVDSHTTKWGKMKPYILFAAAPIAVLTILMYLSPDISGTKLMVFCAVVYIAWGMCYTMADVPFWGLPNVMTPDTRERGSVISFTKIINSVGSALPEIFFFAASFLLPLFIDKNNVIEYNKKKYLIIAVVIVAIGIAMYINSYFHIKERVVPPIHKKKPGEASALKRVFTCKPLMLVLLMGVLSSGRYMVQAAAIHVARYAFYIPTGKYKGVDLASLPYADKVAAIDASVGLVKTIFQICAIVGMFGATLLMPMLMRKVDYKKLLIYTCIAGAAASVGTTLIGWFTNNLYACIPFIIVSSIPLGVINVLTGALIGDGLDYLELKTGYRDNGLGSAIQGFVNKIGSALSTCGIIIMYMLINIDPSEMYSTTAVKSALELTHGQNFAVFSLVSVIPGVSLLLCAIPMFFYKISGKEKDKMIEDLKAKREAEGIEIHE